MSHGLWREERHGDADGGQEVELGLQLHGRVGSEYDVELADGRRDFSVRESIAAGECVDGVRLCSGARGGEADRGSRAGHRREEVEGYFRPS